MRKMDREAQCGFVVCKLARDIEHTFLVRSYDRKVGRRVLVRQKKRNMEAPLVVGEIN
jgi:hypothetical protein